MTVKMSKEEVELFFKKLLNDLFDDNECIYVDVNQNCCFFDISLKKEQLIFYKVSRYSDVLDDE